MMKRTGVSSRRRPLRDWAIFFAFCVVMLFALRSMELIVTGDTS
jgi:hypothetical protein